MITEVKVTIYRTSDGKEFRDKKEAEDWEIKGKFFASIQKWVALPSSTMIEDVASNLWDHRDELREMLGLPDLPILTPKEYVWLMNQLGEKTGRVINPVATVVVINRIKRLCTEDSDD